MTDATSTPASGARPSDELLPFLSNFHDIFTAIGVVILFVGIAIGTSEISGFIDVGDPELVGMGLSLITGLIALGVSWILVRSQRRILPGIILCLIFSANIVPVLIYAFTSLLELFVPSEAFDVFGEAIQDAETATVPLITELSAQFPWVLRIWAIGAGLIASAVVWFYYSAFRLPFAGGLLGLTLVYTLLIVLIVIDPVTALTYAPSLALAAGVVLFLAGIAYDARDPGRTTRLAGTGFWLHFFAAPMILYASIGVVNFGWTFDLSGDGSFQDVFTSQIDTVTSAIATLIIIGGLALVSLLINRRALIVAGLISAGIAIGVVINETGMDGAGVAAVTLLLLGALVVLLGAAWRPVRRVLLFVVPTVGPLGRIFPPADSVHEG